MGDPFEPLPGSEYVRTSAHRKREGRAWRPLLSVPEDAPEPTFHHRTEGSASRWWAYRDAEGRLLGYIVRFDSTNEDGEPTKTLRPRTFCQSSDSRREWRWHGFPKPRPLYGLDRLAARPEAPVLVTEGEKAADAAAQLSPEYVCVSPMHGAQSPHLTDWTPIAGRRVFVWPDADAAGRDFALKVARLSKAAGAASVAIVPVPADFPAGWDLADPRPDGYDLARLRSLLENAQEPPAPPEERAASQGALGLLYGVEDGAITYSKRTRDGDVAVRLCNFSARIVRAIERDDGVEKLGALAIEGRLASGEQLPAVTVPPERFGSLDWVLANWAPRGAIISAGFGNRDHLRCAIQSLSGTFDRDCVYAHLGWCKIGEVHVYLHAGGAIGPNGCLEGVDVELPDTLCRFALPPPPYGDELREAVRRSLLLLDVAPLCITAPLHAAIFAAVLGARDFTLHLAGPTGALKTALAAVAQQHFGAGLDAGHLPGNWSSTANSLENLLFLAKDALCVVDDFAPHGTTADVQRLHREADRLLRNVGNRSGRGRLRADGSLRPTRPPRGLPLSTGEDVPAGQSLRARTLVLEVGPSDVDPDRLGKVQAAAEAGDLASAMAGFLRWLAPQLEERQGELRDLARAWRERSFAHRRTADLLGSLASAHAIFRTFAIQIGALAPAEAEELGQAIDAGLLEAGAAQAELQRGEDPVMRFFHLLAGALVAGEAHVEDADQKGPPQPAQPGQPDLRAAWGWEVRRVRAGQSEHEELVPKGRRIGWARGSDLYLEPEAAFRVAQGFAAGQSAALAITPRTLWRRLAERDLLLSAEAGRHTARPVIQGRQVRVLHFAAAALLSPGSGLSGLSGLPGRADAPESTSHLIRSPLGQPARTGPGYATGLHEGPEDEGEHASRLNSPRSPDSPLGEEEALPEREVFEL